MRKSAPTWIGVIALISLPAHAQRAGTAVSNIAAASYSADGTAERTSSNTARLVLQEVLDIRLSTASGTVGLPLGETGGVPFTLVNGGNGTEAFLLSASAEAMRAELQGFAIDRNGDGIYTPGADSALTGAATPPLAPGQSVVLFALLSPTQIDSAAQLHVHARAATGSGAPGTVFAGRGDGGVDAIVGSTTAEATLDFQVGDGTMMQPEPTASLVKSQSVLAPDGTDRALQDAVITYTLVANFEGEGSAGDAAVRDPIPSGTTYVPGSLMLDDVALSDAADADAGSFDGSAVAVALGSVPAPAIHTIRFQVKVQ